MKTLITLATLAAATAQDVFEQAANHLLAQNEKALNEKGNCQYRFGDKKCAAGIFIADDEYTPKMEGNSWEILAGGGLVNRTHEDLIMALQKVHDQTEPLMWREELYIVGLDFKLDNSFLNLEVTN